MPIRFITLSETYANKIRQHGFDAQTMKIQDYVPRPGVKTYYVSPANSLCFMDGGIDYALSRILFPGIEQEVKQIVKQLGRVSLVGKPYLPIGSSIVLEKGPARGLVVAPTMLLPQDVRGTQNAYWATMAVLHNLFVNKKEKLADVDVLLTSFCCGYGKMDEDESIRQMLQGIRDYASYRPATVVSNCIIVHEPNLQEQPKYYQNTEFFNIPPNEIVRG